MKQHHYLFLIISVLLLVSSCGTVKHSSKRSVSGRRIGAYDKYIDKYASTALDNQRQYGIPASITLAQGLLESNAGCSMLAVSANNHFGIKCHRSWKGKRIYKDDDLANECFRVYGSPAESYRDHAELLQQRRYKRLYALSPTDYKGWAKGLQQCGYATDRGYANKLIKIIEDYQLYLIDKKNVKRTYVVKKSHVTKKTKSVAQKNKRPVYLSYGLLYVKVGVGDDLATIARDMDLSEKKLASYNDFPEGYPIAEGNIIYLQKKNSKAQPPYYEHVVKVGESIHQIAQTYGIRLESLYKLNNLSAEYTPQEGDVLRLQ